MPNTRAQLSVGSNNKEDNLDLQKLLNQKNNAGLQEDGIYGPKTTQAVINYQKANGLKVDGIVGPETWGHLLGGADTAASDVPSLADTVAKAQKDYESFAAQAPGDFSFRQQEELDRARQAWQDRQEFSYDPNADALYGQYKDRYTAAGRLAMEDTMGKAAAMTGGYGNSYAQTAGQQAYQSYLQQLNSKLPELYQLAYSRYADETDRLYDQYDALQTERDRAYSEHRDALDRYDTQKGELYSLYQDAQSQQDAAYSRLYSMILDGYIPTDWDLKNAGMTRAMANAIANG